MDTNIDIEFYKVFCEVAKSGSFSKAAQKLYISQPAITQTIKKLEEQLGGKLFYRNNNGVTLTEEGKHLYEYIKDSMTILENASFKFKQYKDLEDGIIRIRTGRTNAENLLFKPLIQFSKDYPNIKIEISAGSPEDSLKNVSLGKIDISILDIEHYKKYSNVSFKEVAKNEYIFIASKEYYEKNNVNIKNIEDLKKYSLILPKDTTSAKKILDTYLNDETVIPNYGMVSEIIRKELVKKGLGIGFVTKSSVENELKTGELIEIKLNKPNSISKVGIATLIDETSSFATKKLVEYILEFNN